VKPRPNIPRCFGVVGVGVGWSVVEQVENHLPAAIGHVVGKHTACSWRVYGPQDKNVGFVLDHPPCVSRYLVEIGNGVVFLRCRIDLTLGDALYSNVRSGRPEHRSVSERLHGVDLDLSDRHY